MTSKTERVVIAAAAIVLGSSGGMVGAGLGAVAADYAIKKLEKRGEKKPK